ncbi:GvpL/GvpF family gas vesicle protein [Streptomyces sp. NPDC005017]|uniref:GvpL/GvpF family gas vesicle protein n=1 Tax=Streptomyces sp. NPDC005017 TaxID=3364706 RepID=UPI0036C7F1DF
MSTYVYGIVRASHPTLPDGVEGIGDPPQPVRVLAQGQVAAIISSLHEELRPKRRHLLAHQRVLDAAGSGGVVLPMRFGSLSPDDDTVSLVLSDYAEDFLKQLQALDGRAEYNLKANHDEEAVLRLVTAEDPQIRSLAAANREAGGGSHEDRLRLGEMIAAAVQAREAEDADLVRRTVEPAAEAVSTGPQSSGWLVNLSFLVERSAAGRFRDAVDALGQEHPHLELRLAGPMPPYSFVTSAFGSEPENPVLNA